MSLPPDLFTNAGIGPFRRLRVDTAQTGFFAGREFRTFHEFTMTNGQIIVIKALVPIDIILFGVKVDLNQGQIRVETLIGGTEGGTFSVSLPVFNRNTTSKAAAAGYANQVTLTTGGTLTGGTLLDVFSIKVASNNNFAETVGATQGDERGIGAGTYYYRLTATGDTIGMFSGRWEERPEGVY